MLKFILVASIVILFLVFSIPILIAEKNIGKKDPEKKGRQCLSIVRFMFRFILRVAGVHVTVKGIENIPKDQAVLYVGNHRSYFDILVGYTTVPTPLGFMAKKEMESIPLLSNWMRNVNCLFLDRQNIREGVKAILDGVAKVKAGVSIWIFPEGTRNDAQDYLELMPFKEGSLKIAEKTGCPVVPVAITGTAEVYESHFPRITSSQVTIEFGKPFIIKGLEPEKKKFVGAHTRELIIDMLKEEKKTERGKIKMDLLKIRDQLDVIDKEIVRLFEERMELVGQVAEFKIETGKQVFDKEREQAKIAAVRGLAHGPFNEQAMEEVFTQLMTISRRFQYRLLEEHGQKVELDFKQMDRLPVKDVRVVYQGVEGAYSHGAALAYFGDDADVYHVKTFEDAMKAVEAGEADYGVIPIENSSAGAVTDNYDLLLCHDNVIVGEICVPVNHMLLGIPGASLQDIRTVYSHPQALMQSSQYLNAHPQWQQFSVANTAVAAKKVLEDQDKTQAAVASQVAGRLYGLVPLAEGINHNKNNATRFIILAKDHIYCKDAAKISLCFELPHKSGTLYNMLGNLIYNGVNMRMIESRPIPGRNWEYRFFVDIEGNLSEPSIQNALKGVAEEAANMRILGNY